MTKHTLVGVYGDDDYHKAKQGDHSTVINFISPNERFNYGIEDVLLQLAELSIQPSEIGIDVLVLAAMVYAADTRISRNTESENNWTREVRLIVPVSNVPQWSLIARELETMLKFLTGDRWEISFTRRSPKFTHMSKKVAPALLGSPPTSLALFSGGLDSLIDAITMLARGEKCLLISHTGEGATSKTQDHLIANLEKAYGKDKLKRLRLWMTFPTNLIPDVPSEGSTRGRSFLFIALGVCAASAFPNGMALRIPENGFIALNVALDASRIGALSTRTTHPFYLARWNAVLKALGIKVSIINPYKHMTKGEMIKDCKEKTVLSSLIPHSMSCSSPTKGRWSGNSTQHCGYCLPCLIRRAAIVHGLGQDKTNYLINLENETLSAKTAKGKQVRAFQVAIQRLKDDPASAKIFIHKPGPLADVLDEIDNLASVYSNGMEEVNFIIKKTKTFPL